MFKGLKNIKKLHRPYFVGFVFGMLVMYLFIQPQVISKEKQTKIYSDQIVKNQNLVTQNKEEISSCKSQLASTSAQIEVLVNRPDPTPQVIYKTQIKEVDVGCPLLYTRTYNTALGCIPAVSLCY